MKRVSKEEIKEEARLYRINDQDDGAFCGFIAGAEWMQEQLSTPAPQVAEVRTLEEAAKIDAIEHQDFINRLSIEEKQCYNTAFAFGAEIFKAKSDHLQAELVECKENYFIVTRKYESLENENLNIKAELEQVTAEREMLSLKLNCALEVLDNNIPEYLKRYEQALQSTKQ